MRIDAALTDELELGQAFEQVRPDGGSFADEHEAFGVFQPPGERVGVLHVVVPDRHLVADKLPEAGKVAQRIEIIVQDRNLHASRSC
jgi:hypothetical protein